MKISSWTDMTHSFMSIAPQSRNASAPLARSGAQSVDQREQIVFARKKVNDLEKALKIVGKNWRRSGKTSSFEAASTRSAANLGLDTLTATQLESTAEVNATATSFGTHGPEWSGSSTSLVTIDGEYDGSLGTGVMTFEATKSGGVGDKGLKIDVFKPDGSLLETVNFNGSYVPGEVITLSNGLEISLGEGDLNKNDTFTLDVSAVTGGVADPDLAFNGARTGDANLEYGLEVTAGSFELNGETINVAADDSITSVLDKINASAAGVTASYSATTELISLIHNTPGTGGEITLLNDTSGFLAATKLAGATAVEGLDNGYNHLMKDVSMFAGVTVGDIFINGIAIAIDPDLDTLQDVVDRINGSAAGATASIDHQGQSVVITSNNTEDSLSLDDNGRGFLPALNLTSATFDPAETSRDGSRMTGHRARRIADAMRDASEAINALFGIVVPGEEPGFWLKRVRGDLERNLNGFLEGRGKSKLDKVGIRINWNAPTGHVFSFSGKARAQLTAAIGTHSNTVEDLLFATQNAPEVGFVDGLLAATKVTKDYLDNALNPTGSYLDTYA